MLSSHRQQQQQAPPPQQVTVASQHYSATAGGVPRTFLSSTTSAAARCLPRYAQWHQSVPDGLLEGEMVGVVSSSSPSHSSSSTVANNSVVGPLHHHRHQMSVDLTMWSTELQLVPLPSSPPSSNGGGGRGGGAHHHHHEQQQRQQQYLHQQHLVVRRVERRRRGHHYYGGNGSGGEVDDDASDGIPSYRRRAAEAHTAAASANANNRRNKPLAIGESYPSLPLHHHDGDDDDDNEEDFDGAAGDHTAGTAYTLKKELMWAPNRGGGGADDSVTNATCCTCCTIADPPPPPLPVYSALRARVLTKEAYEAKLQSVLAEAHYASTTTMTATDVLARVQAPPRVEVDLVPCPEDRVTLAAEGLCFVPAHVTLAKPQPHSTAAAAGDACENGGASPPTPSAAAPRQRIEVPPTIWSLWSTARSDRFVVPATAQHSTCADFYVVDFSAPHRTPTAPLQVIHIFDPLSPQREMVHSIPLPWHLDGLIALKLEGERALAASGGTAATTANSVNTRRSTSSANGGETAARQAAEAKSEGGHVPSHPVAASGTVQRGNSNRALGASASSSAAARRPHHHEGARGSAAVAKSGRSGSSSSKGRDGRAPLRPAVTSAPRTSAANTTAASASSRVASRSGSAVPLRRGSLLSHRSDADGTNTDAEGGGDHCRRASSVVSTAGGDEMEEVHGGEDAPPSVPAPCPPPAPPNRTWQVLLPNINGLNGSLPKPFIVFSQRAQRVFTIHSCLVARNTMQHVLCVWRLHAPYQLTEFIILPSIPWGEEGEGGDVDGDGAAAARREEEANEDAEEEREVRRLGPLFSCCGIRNDHFAVPLAEQHLSRYLKRTPQPILSVSLRSTTASASLSTGNTTTASPMCSSLLSTSGERLFITFQSFHTIVYNVSPPMTLNSDGTVTMRPTVLSPATVLVGEDDEGEEEDDGDDDLYEADQKRNQRRKMYFGAAEVFGVLSAHCAGNIATAAPPPQAAGGGALLSASAAMAPTMDEIDRLRARYIHLSNRLSDEAAGIYYGGLLGGGGGGGAQHHHTNRSNNQRPPPTPLFPKEDTFTALQRRAIVASYVPTALARAWQQQQQYLLSLAAAAEREGPGRRAAGGGPYSVVGTAAGLVADNPPLHHHTDAHDEGPTLGSTRMADGQWMTIVPQYHRGRGADGRGGGMGPTTSHSPHGHVSAEAGHGAPQSSPSSSRQLPLTSPYAHASHASPQHNHNQHHQQQQQPTHPSGDGAHLMVTPRPMPTDRQQHYGHHPHHDDGERAAALMAGTPRAGPIGLQQQQQPTGSSAPHGEDDRGCCASLTTPMSLVSTTPQRSYHQQLHNPNYNNNSGLPLSPAPSSAALVTSPPSAAHVSSASAPPPPSRGNGNSHSAVIFANAVVHRMVSKPADRIDGIGAATTGVGGGGGGERIVIVSNIGGSNGNSNSSVVTSGSGAVHHHHPQRDGADNHQHYEVSPSQRNRHDHFDAAPSSPSPSYSFSGSVTQQQQRSVSTTTSQQQEQQHQRSTVAAAAAAAAVRGGGGKRPSPASTGGARSGGGTTSTMAVFGPHSFVSRAMAAMGRQRDAGLLGRYWADWVGYTADRRAALAAADRAVNDSNNNPNNNVKDAADNLDSQPHDLTSTSAVIGAAAHPSSSPSPSPSIASLLLPRRAAHMVWEGTVLADAAAAGGGGGGGTCISNGGGGLIILPMSLLFGGLFDLSAASSSSSPSHADLLLPTLLRERVLNSGGPASTLPAAASRSRGAAVGSSSSSSSSSLLAALMGDAHYRSCRALIAACRARSVTLWLTAPDDEVGSYDTLRATTDASSSAAGDGRDVDARSSSSSSVVGVSYGAVLRRLIEEIEIEGEEGGRRGEGDAATPATSMGRRVIRNICGLPSLRRGYRADRHKALLMRYYAAMDSIDERGGGGGASLSPPHHSQQLHSHLTAAEAMRESRAAEDALVEGLKETVLLRPFVVGSGAPSSSPSSSSSTSPLPLLPAAVLVIMPSVYHMQCVRVVMKGPTISTGTGASSVVGRSDGDGDGDVTAAAAAPLPRVSTPSFIPATASSLKVHTLLAPVASCSDAYRTDLVDGLAGAVARPLPLAPSPSGTLSMSSSCGNSAIFAIVDRLFAQAPAAVTKGATPHNNRGAAGGTAASTLVGMGVPHSAIMAAAAAAAGGTVTVAAAAACGDAGAGAVAAGDPAVAAVAERRRRRRTLLGETAATCGDADDCASAAVDDVGKVVSPADGSCPSRPFSSQACALAMGGLPLRIVRECSFTGETFVDLMALVKQ